MPDPLWSVLIATVGERNADLQRTLDVLAVQIDRSPAEIEVVVAWDEHPRQGALGAARQRLLDDARGEYVSFVDDDDELPAYYVERVVEALQARPAYVGWRMQCFIGGAAQKPTFHSLRYPAWSDDEHGYYRHISHLNPIRTELARRGRFDRHVPEDVDWSLQVYASLDPTEVDDDGALTMCEAFIDDVMYLYRYEPKRSLWSKPKRKHGSYTRPLLPMPFMRYVESA